jgi:hypothetical protein
MDKKQRVDTVSGAVSAMSDALAGPIEPPAHVRLRDGDRAFWDAIVTARARNKWDGHDLGIAANLARAMADIERYQVQLDREGATIENLKGTPIMNPLHSVIETLTRRAVALSRTLHVHAEAKQGKAKLQGKALEAEQDARDQVSQLDDDDLIPGLPRH